MNDVPAVVAWLIALAVALLVAPALLLLRRAGTPPAPRWRHLVLGWLTAATFLGPFIAAGGGVLLNTFLQWREVIANPGERLGLALPAALIVGGIYVSISVFFFALPYLPVLLLWARLGPWLGWLERTHVGVALSSLVLALPGALTAVFAYGILDAPFGFKGAELLQFGSFILFAIAVSLFVPRVVFPALRPGRFAPEADGVSPSAT